jgi:acetyl esterase
MEPSSHKLDTDLRALIDRMNGSGGFSLSDLSLAELRDRVAAGDALMASGPPVYEVWEDTARADGRSVPVRVYQPDAVPSGRCLSYVHGGGWVTGNLDYADPLCRLLAAQTGRTVVSVDYRRAPEHPFPAALEDVLVVWEWSAHTYGSGRGLAVVGDSAGAHLCAVAAMEAGDRDDQTWSVEHQTLIYPVLDVSLTAPSMLDYGNGYLLTAADMNWFWDQFDPQGLRFDGEWRLAPLNGPMHLAPPALIAVAGFDPLQDGARRYASELALRGIACEVVEFPRLTHGFCRYTGISEGAERATLELVRRVSKALRQ